MTEAATIEELRRRLEQQEKAVMALRDEAAIRDTLYRYCHALDYGLEDEWIDCFTDGASWHWTVRDQLIQDAVHQQGLGLVPIGTQFHGRTTAQSSATVGVTGREALQQMVANHTKAPQRWHKHCVVNARVRLKGDVAEVDSYFVRIDGFTRSSAAYIRAFGRYLDGFVRCPDGVWRIEARHCEVEAHFDESMLGENSND